MNSTPTNLFEAAFSGEEHRTFTLNGTNGCAAVLVHGFPGTPAEMRDLANLLHADGWTTHAPLLPGFGADIASIAHRGLDDWRATVASAITAMRRDHHRLLLIGHSMGGALAIDAAAHDAPDALLTLCPFWTIDSPLWAALPALSLVFRQVQPFRLFKPDFTDPEMRAGMRQFMPTADLDDPAVQAQIVQFAIPTRIFTQIRAAGMAGYAAAERVSVPALVIQGDADRLVQPARTRILAARLRARMETVPGEHNLPIGTAESWAHVARHVRAFAAAVAQTAPA
jgi:carboxylesterase